MLILIFVDLILLILIVVLKKLVNRFVELKRYKVDVNNPQLVDSVIVQGQSTAFKIGRYNLYLQPATVDTHLKYMRMFEKFISLHASEVKAIELLTFSEALQKKEVRKVSKLARKFFMQKSIGKQLDRLIKTAFLIDRRINPSKISLKYYRKNATIDERLQLFFLTISLNVDAVANFIKALQNRGSNAKQEQRIFSFGLWKNTKSALPKQKLIPRYKPFYFSKENPNGKKRDEILPNSKIRKMGVNK